MFARRLLPVLLVVSAVDARAPSSLVTRRVFPEESPLVCACLLSFNRLDLLRRTLTCERTNTHTRARSSDATNQGCNRNALLHIFLAWIRPVLEKASVPLATTGDKQLRKLDGVQRPVPPGGPRHQQPRRARGHGGGARGGALLTRRVRTAATSSENNAPTVLGLRYNSRDPTRRVPALPPQNAVGFLRGGGRGCPLDVMIACHNHLNLRADDTHCEPLSTAHRPPPCPARGGQVGGQGARCKARDAARWTKAGGGRTLFRFHPDVTRKTPREIANPARGRRTQVVLERLRTGSAIDNSILKHIHPQRFDGSCDKCTYSQDSPEHRILQCAALAPLRPFITHMELEETNIPYQVIWFDNGSTDKEELQRIQDEFQIDKFVPEAYNSGIAHALNTMFFELCDAPFILSLEEDWEWMMPAAASRDDLYKNALGLAIEVLNYDSSVASIILREEHEYWFTKTKRSEKKYLPSGVEYRLHCLNLQANHVWGAYTNGASLMHAERLRQIGKMYGEFSKDMDGNEVQHDGLLVRDKALGFPRQFTEANYALRVGLKYCSAVIRLVASCDSDVEVDAICNAVFRHIGTDRGHGVDSVASFKGEPPDESWILFGTHMHEAYRTMREEL